MHLKPSSIHFELSDGILAGWHWENRDKPRLVFVHANGFNAGTYRQFLSPLSSEFDIIALDLRGHGRSELTITPQTHKSWSIYSQDLCAAAAKLDRPADLLCGHSMGGTCLMLAAQHLKITPKLALIEPVILPGIFYSAYQLGLGWFVNLGNSLSSKALRRTRNWADQQSVLDRYKDRSPFNRWAEGVLEDYLKDGLKEVETGVQLSCEPEWEAANFKAQKNLVFQAIRQIGPYIQVYQAEYGSTVLNPDGLRRYGAQVENHNGLSHLAPMEDPEGLAAWVFKTWADTGSDQPES